MKKKSLYECLNRYVLSHQVKLLLNCIDRNLTEKINQTWVDFDVLQMIL